MIDNIKNKNLNGGVCSIQTLNWDPKGTICNKCSLWVMTALASILYCSCRKNEFEHNKLAIEHNKLAIFEHKLT